MTVYTRFLGVDMGKFTFVAAAYEDKATKEYKNTPLGITQFVKDHACVLADALTVVETTGGYELPFIYALVSHGFKVHRADTRKVKNFIRSFGNAAKTDALDAKALAKYAHERGDSLDLFCPTLKDHRDIFALVQRRNDLTRMLVAEKNRSQSPNECAKVKSMITKLITVLSKQIKLVEVQIEAIIDNNPELKKRRDILKTVPGIGKVIAVQLITLLPELGTVCRRKIASLAGVAPRAQDSGRFSGYRRTGPGRSGIKSILFIAAMAARNSKSPLKVFYEKLIQKGKKKMVALTALMRKILTIANARLKSNGTLKHS